MRLIYWDKFGHPPEYLARASRDFGSVLAYWWYDAERAKQTARNQVAGVPSHAAAPGRQYDAVLQDWWHTNERPMPDAE